MAADDFDRWIAGLERELDDLRARSARGRSDDSWSEEAIQTVDIGLTELAAACEELRAQNDDLAAADLLLEAERRRYRDLFDLAPDAYLVTDLGGVIREANQAAARLLRVEPRFLAGKPLDVYVAGEDRTAFTLRLLDLRSAPESQLLHLVIRPRDAAPVAAALSVAVARDAASEPTALYWLVREVTDGLPVPGAESSQRQVALLRSGNDALQASEQRLRALLGRLLEVQDLETRRLARRLKEELSQVLLAIRRNLEGMLRVIPVAPLPRKTYDLTEQALQLTRHLMFEAHLPLLEEAGLAAALRWLLAQQEALGHFVATVTSDTFDERPSPAIEAACFRLAREALANVVHHARAANVQVELRHAGAGFELRIRDDGRGFDLDAARGAAPGPAVGLTLMEECTRLAGGRLDVVSTPSQGTELRAWFPLETDARPAAAGPGREPQP